MIETSRALVSRRSDEIDLRRDNLEMIVSCLEEELRNSNTPGIGLAAIQIGITKRVAIVRLGEMCLNLWNPEIVESQGRVLSSEGCLSVPGLMKSVARTQEVMVRNGDGKEYVLYGLEAIVAQHEIDHMNGITIADKEHRALRVGRNELCLCGSGKKFKRCHLGNEIELQQVKENR